MATILIVDDHAPTVEHISRLLTEAGHQADYLLESSYVTQKLENDSVDLILLDIYMPDQDGLTVLKSIRTNAESRDIPVIMITGETEDRLVQECFLQGAVDFLTKPVHRLELISRIETALLARDYIRAMEEQKNSLAQAKEFIETVLNSMADVLCVIDAHSMEILEVNQAFEIMEGVERQQVVGSRCFQKGANRHHPCFDCPVTSMDDTDSCLFNATFVDGEFHARHGDYMEADGTPRRVYMIANAVLDIRGGIRQIVYQCRDDTEFYLLQKRCKQAAGSGQA